MIDNLVVSVSVEGLVHKAIMELAEEIYKDFDVKIDSIDFTWENSLSGESRLTNSSITTSKDN